MWAQDSWCIHCCKSLVSKILANTYKWIFENWNAWPTFQIYVKCMFLQISMAIETDLLSEPDKREHIKKFALPLIFVYIEWFKDLLTSCIRKFNSWCISLIPNGQKHSMECKYNLPDIVYEIYFVCLFCWDQNAS